MVSAVLADYLSDGLLVALVVGTLLRVVHYEVHELIEAAKHTAHLPTTVQLD